MNKKAIIYCRTATEHKELSALIKRQVLTCVRYAQSNGYEISDIAYEYGSGTTINKQLRRVIRELSLGKIKTIIAFDRTRISRDYALYLKTIEVIKKCGGEVKFTNVLDCAETSLIEGILLSFENAYTHELSERTNDGLAQRKQQKTALPK